MPSRSCRSNPSGLPEAAVAKRPGHSLMRTAQAHASAADHSGATAVDDVLRMAPIVQATWPRTSIAVTSSASLVHQLPCCEARSCCHGAAIQQEGPTAVPGDQASHLQLPGSGGKI